MNPKQQKQPMGFGKTFLASLLGMLVAGILLCFIFVIMLTASISSALSGFEELDKKPVIKENSILHITLDQEITDNGPHRKFNLGLSGMEEQGKQGLNEITESIEHAKTDKNIKGIFLDLSSVKGGWATVESIRNTLLDFKKSKKFIVAYGEVMDQRAYYLASTADKIYLFSTGLIQHTGMYSELMFFKGLIDKLGLDVSIIRGSNNKFKSAVEPFMYEKMSDANRMQISRIQQVVWQNVLKGISAQRGISVEELNRLADEAIIKNPKAALENKMVDELVYRDQVIDALKKKSGIKDEKKLRLVKVGRYYASFSDNVKSRSLLVEAAKDKRKNKIAVIYATGEIVDGNGDHETIGSITLSKEIRRARLDKSVKAIVLRIDSPGGSALASEVIWRETELAKKTKPFIVSMGDVAASGGYYIACSAHKIYAEPTTMTGSIGVFGILPHTERFFKENTGITFDRVKSNKHSDIGSTTRKMDEVEYKIIQEGVDEIYDQFTKRVADGRGLDHSLVKDSIGEGRVWMGTDALALGLVDEIGGLDVAIDEAAKRAKLKDYSVANYPEIMDPFEELLERITQPDKKESEDEDESKSQQTTRISFQDDLLYSQFKTLIGEGNIKAYKSALNLISTKGVKAALPYYFVE
ncbi:MAG TPA: signal peptide peptidase SppA [Flavobacteriales bacterium]|nr:signal peptide peptidase SppA [Flavobacteriales bacterium]